MRQTLSAEKWQQSVQHVRALLTLCLLTLSLTASLTALAYRTSGDLILLLAQSVAALGALLHLGIAAMLLRLALRASATKKRLQAHGGCTAQRRPLRRSILGVVGAAVQVLMMSVAVIALPIALPVVMRVPEAGMMFVILIVALLLLGVSIRRSCRWLTEALAQAEWAVRSTVVA